MGLAVVNYPTLSNDDFQWIQSVRKEHDNLFFECYCTAFHIGFSYRETQF